MIFQALTTGQMTAEFIFANISNNVCGFAWGIILIIIITIIIIYRIKGECCHGYTCLFVLNSTNTGLVSAMCGYDCIKDELNDSQILTLSYKQWFYYVYCISLKCWLLCCLVCGLNHHSNITEQSLVKSEESPSAISFLPAYISILL